MRIFLMSLLWTFITVSIATAQTKPSKVPVASDTTKKTAAIFPALEKAKPKPYVEVITNKAVTRKGMITVHQLDDKFFFEIADSLLGRDILVVGRISKTGPETVGLLTGDEINNCVVRFEKGPSNKLFMRKITYKTYSPDSTSALYQNLQRANIQPIAAVFNIAAFSPNKKGSVIEMTDYINSDNDIFYFNSAATKTNFKLVVQLADRSYILSVKSFPSNVEINVIKSYSVAPPASGSTTIELNASMVLLPKVPMKPRYFDPRIGYFTTGYIDFNTNPQGVRQTDLIKRWKLEPKPADMERYKRGELVEPVKPIIFFIDPATPKDWVPYLIAGVNDWQKAFEKAGFKNAIMAKMAPVTKEDSTWSLQDARHSAIVYKPSEVSNASGPSISDPRSGEIIESHINWYHNVMKLVHDWYMIQAGAIDPRARKMTFDSQLMGDLIRFVSSHEVGHTLGLRHNFGSSSTVPSEKLRDKAYLEANGHTPSIMDYARFNYVAQPEDSISTKGIYPRIGDYDLWAIEWGYRYYPDIKTSAEEVPVLNKVTIEKLKNKRLWFGSEEADDPRSQSEDLGDNPMISGMYGIKNLKRVLSGLPEWTSTPNEGYENLQDLYKQVIGQYLRYAGHVIRYIGGTYETTKTVEQKGPVFVHVPKSKQQEAMAFLSEYLFTTPTWLVDQSILEKTGGNGPEYIPAIQGAFLSALLGTYPRLLKDEILYGASAYNVADLFQDVQKTIFSELKSGASIDMYRRNLQKTYVNILSMMIKSDKTQESDIVSRAKGQLKDLAVLIKSALGNASGDTKLHLEDLSERINKVLNP